MKEAIIYFTVAIGIFMALFYGVTYYTFHLIQIGCDRESEATGLPTKLVGDMWVNGCFILVDGKWIDSDNYGMGFTQK